MTIETGDIVCVRSRDAGVFVGMLAGRTGTASPSGHPMRPADLPSQISADIEQVGLQRFDFGVQCGDHVVETFDLSESLTQVHWSPLRL